MVRLCDVSTPALTTYAANCIFTMAMFWQVAGYLVSAQLGCNILKNKIEIGVLLFKTRKRCVGLSNQTLILKQK